METNFSEQNSLNLISEMIMQARSNYRKGAGSYCIFWGYFIAALAIINFGLLHYFLRCDCGINTGYASYIWLATIPTFIIYFIYVKTKAKSDIVRTHIDIIIYNTWLAFGISSFLLVLVLNLFATYFKSGNAVFLITPVMSILVGLAQFVSGQALKFKPYVYSAYIFWIGSVLCMLSLMIFDRGDLQFIIFAICMILGFSVPGHILNRKASENV
ncbi:hypothetical protein [Dysgonomonas massiliensis]|uniref:hypothetical protein n=1 Tax=Dysgonomonas massiliensis TaxID=2040292 RepID=UPI000C770F85|nr:hypothetical protein [Dysgonomonas massiliensis]